MKPPGVEGGCSKLGVLVNATQLLTKLEMNDRFQFFKWNRNKKVVYFFFFFLNTNSKEREVPALGNQFLCTPPPSSLSSLSKHKMPGPERLYNIASLLFCG